MADESLFLWLHVHTRAFTATSDAKFFVVVVIFVVVRIDVCSKYRLLSKLLNCVEFTSKCRELIFTVEVSLRFNHDAMPLVSGDARIIEHAFLLD